MFEFITIIGITDYGNGYMSDYELSSVKNGAVALPVTARIAGPSAATDFGGSMNMSGGAAIDKLKSRG